MMMANGLSITLGLFIGVLAFSFIGIYRHTLKQKYMLDLMVEATYTCVFSMPHMMIFPLLEAVWKFVLTFVLFYNLRVLVAVGFYDDHRIVVNGEYFKGLSARFHFDWRMIPWILFWSYGTVWILEIATSLGQFLISFTVISWYFMPKDAKGQKAIDPRTPRMAVLVAFMYHFGTLAFGAAVVPFFRIFRIPMWILNRCLDAISDKHKEYPLETWAMGLILAAVFGGGVGTAMGFMHGKEAGVSIGVVVALPIVLIFSLTPAWLSPKRCTKTAFCDTIIRSQHFWFATTRADQVMDLKHIVKIRDLIMPVTLVGVLSVSVLCAGITHLLLATDTYSNPATHPETFIEEPAFVVILAFAMCGSISYGILSLMDVSADTMLFCFAYHKKHKKEYVDKFIPEVLVDLVSHIPGFQEKMYPFHGAAANQPEKFLAYWTSKPAKADSKGMGWMQSMYHSRK